MCALVYVCAFVRAFTCVCAFVHACVHARFCMHVRQQAKKKIMLGHFLSIKEPEDLARLAQIQRQNFTGKGVLMNSTKRLRDGRRPSGKNGRDRMERACGDGVREELMGEACDDGDLEWFDGCSGMCTGVCVCVLVCEAERQKQKSCVLETE